MPWSWRRRPVTVGDGIAVAIGLMNVATYAYTMVAARLLGPQEYGAFAGLMATLLVISVLQLGLQATAARRLLRHGVDLDDRTSADRARRLLGDHAYATLTSGPDSLPRFDSFTRAVSAVEQLTERPPG